MKTTFVISLVFSFLLAAPAYGDVGVGSVVALPDGVTPNDYRVNSGSMVYRLWLVQIGGYSGPSSMHFQRSLDGGATWEAEIMLRPATRYMLNADIAAAGAAVFIAYRDKDRYGSTYCDRSPEFIISNDYGATFTRSYLRHPPPSGDLQGPACWYGGPKVAVDSYGTLYTAFGACRPNDPYQCHAGRSTIYLAKSSDGGESFEWVNGTGSVGTVIGDDHLMDLFAANPGVYLFWQNLGSRFMRYLY